MPAASGFRVRVPVGSRTVDGFIVGDASRDARTTATLRALHAIDPRPMLTDVTLALGPLDGEALRLRSRRGVPDDRPGARARRRTRRARSASRRSRSRAEAIRALLPDLRAKKPKLAQARALDEILDAGGAVPVHRLARAAASRARRSPRWSSTASLAIRSEEAEEDALRADPARAHDAAPISRVDQEAAVTRLLETFAMVCSGERPAATFLLRGVTGSGKTEVYLRAAEAALARGRGVIMLVPEIALTPQTVERLRGRLGDVAVLHSNQSDSARAHQWEMLRTRTRPGRARAAVGPLRPARATSGS